MKPQDPAWKPPGRLAMAARRKARAAAPYAAGLVAAGILAVVLHINCCCSVPGPGMAGMHAGIRLLEERGTRRAAGRRAARQRAKYQGMASRRETGTHMSAAAARRKARFTRPQTTRPSPRP